MWLQHKYELVFEGGDPRKGKVVERDDAEMIQLVNLDRFHEFRQKGDSIVLSGTSDSGGTLRLRLDFPDTNLARAKAKRLQTVLLTTGELIT